MERKMEAGKGFRAGLGFKCLESSCAGATKEIPLSCL